MKKLLALVLALVMVLGLATVSTSAAYSDQDDINYEEAVAVMTAIGVFQGKGSNFDPKANLNRAEAAKIVAYLMLGNKTAENLKGIGTKFTDVPASHWAAGYIEYLASVGIVSGVGGGRFDPNGQVTAVQLAKMLLVALGYDATIEGFVGSDWAINIQSMANKVGIYDGNKGVLGTAPVTRDEAALYAFNTIKSPLVEYEEKGNKLSFNGAELSFGASNAKYMTTTGTSKTQTIDDEKVNGTNAYIVEFAEQYYPDLKYVNYGNDYNDFGEPIHKWTNKNVEVGSYVVKGDLLETYTKKVTAKMLYDLLGKDRYDSVTSNSIHMQVWEDGVRTFSVGENYASYAAATQASGSNANVVDKLLSRNDSYQISSTGNGSVTEVFVDGDNNINVVTYHTYVYQAASDYNASAQTLTLTADVGDTENVGKTLKSLDVSFKDFEQIADYKEDDYLLVSVHSTSVTGNTGLYEVGKITKATIKTGTVEGFKVDSSVTLDGETTNYSEKTRKLANGGVRGTTYSVGQEASVVLDLYGNIIAIDDAVVNSNYVFIAKFGSEKGFNKDITAEAYFTDGTSGEISVNKAYNANNTEFTPKSSLVSNKNTAAGYGALSDHGASYGVGQAGWYTYSKNSDGSYNLYKRLGDNLRQSAYQYDSTKATVTTNDKVLFLGDATTDDLSTTFANSYKGATGVMDEETIRANSKTIFVVEDSTNDDLFVYTGVENTPNINVGASGYATVFAAYKTTNSYASYVFITTYGATVSIDGGDTENLLYVVGNEGSYWTTDNKQYFKIRVLNENRSSFSTVNAKISGEEFDYEAIYRVRHNSDDELTGGDLISKRGAYAYNAAVDVDGNGTISDAETAARVANTAVQKPVFFNGKYITAKGITNSTVNNKNGKITYNNETLWLNGEGYTLAKDAKITLVLANKNDAVSALMSDAKEDREAIPVSASALASRLNLYPNAVYGFQARLNKNYNEDKDRQIQELFVTVTDDGVVANTNTTTVTLQGKTDADKINTASSKVNNVTYAGPTTVDNNSTAVPVTIKAHTNYIITDVEIAGTGASIVSGSVDANGDWSGVISVGTAAVTLNVTTKASVKLSYTAKQSVIVTEAGGSAVPMTATSAFQTMSAKSQGEAITFTVQWGGSVEAWNKVVRYSDGTAITPFDAQLNTYTYSIAADPAKDTIIIGAESYALTVPTGLTATWANTTPSDTANKNAFLAETSGITGNGAARQVPYGANVVLTVTDVPTNWAKYTVTHNYSTYATTNPNAADAIINATNANAPTAKFTAFVMPQGDDAVTLATATAAVRIPYAGISVAKAGGSDVLTPWTASSTNVAVASGFANATYIYLTTTTTNVTLSGILLASGTTGEKTTLTATGTATPAVVQGAGDVDSTTDTITYNASKTTGYSVVMKAGTAASGEVALLGVTLSDWA